MRRFVAHGESGLHDRSSRPTRVRKRISARDVARIWRRRRQREGPLAISWNTGIASSTVYAVLRRNEQGRLRDMDREEREPGVRYEHAAPGDLLHIDVKKLGRLGDGGRWRFGGRAAKKRNRGGGFDFVHVAIDDHSRLAYVEVHDDERADTVADFTRAAIEYYAEHGIKRSHTMPYRPQANGKAERFIRLLINGWAYRRPYESNRERLTALPRWILNYNHGVRTAASTAYHRSHGCPVTTCVGSQLGLAVQTRWPKKSLCCA